MSGGLSNLLLVVVYFGVLLALTKPLGVYMHRVFSGERTFLSPILQPLERGVYRLTAVDAAREMRWTTYLVRSSCSTSPGSWSSTGCSACKGDCPSTRRFYRGLRRPRPSTPPPPS